MDLTLLNVLCVFLLLLRIRVAKPLEYDCPSLVDADSLSQTQLVQRLTHGCRFDRLERPLTYSMHGERLPVDVYVRAYIYFMQNLEAHDLQFKIHALFQLRFLDPRLAFRKVAPKRQQPILGEKPLRDTLWMPHIFLTNERDSSILGTTERDILTSISPDGTVIISSRVKATLYCWMDLRKFPFDEQTCSTIFESWMYNTSELVLHWEQKRPITFDPALHLTEFMLHGAWSNETVINADLKDLRHGAFAGNYSSLSFTVHLKRQVGFYIMDYFLPSMLIVGISWVSFWLQADQAPPRITLGTSTMLTFITLASAQGKTLPKVSYIKVSEVWFLGCTLFIFGSLVEFAFVNTIWRRKRNINVKKIKSRHIFKATLPQTFPRGFSCSHQQRIRSRSFSAASANNGKRNADTIALTNMPSYNHYMTVHAIPITAINEHQDHADNDLPSSCPERPTRIDISTVESAGEEQTMHSHRIGWTTLTPQEIACWIDRKSQCFFPMAFLCFNAFFWFFVYVL